MRAVTKEQFFAALGGLNVHPQIQPGPYPYTSLWKLADSRTVVGRTVGKAGGGCDYFLEDSQ